MRDKMNVIADFLDEVGREVGSSDPRFAAASEYANDVREVLAPGGWTSLREEVGVYTTNVPLTVHVGLRDALKAKRKNLSLLVTDGYRKVLAGEWTPPQPARLRGLKGGHAVLNVTVDDELRKQLREALPGLKQKLGYDRKLTESWVAVSYLRDHLDVSDEDIAAFARVAELNKPAE